VHCQTLEQVFTRGYHRSTFDNMRIFVIVNSVLQLALSLYQITVRSRNKYWKYWQLMSSSNLRAGERDLLVYLWRAFILQVVCLGSLRTRESLRKTNAVNIISLSLRSIHRHLSDSKALQPTLQAMIGGFATRARIKSIAARPLKKDAKIKK
jgi:hypothetical protein